MTEKKSVHKRTLTGTVVSDKMQKTIVVRVERRVKHPRYGKYLTRSQRYKVHDEKGTAKRGDWVMIVESRPLSRDKRWALHSVVRKGTYIEEVTV